MYIECDTRSLSEAVKHVQRAVSDKSSLAVLEGILLKAYDDGLFLNGYNIEYGINTRIDTRIVMEGEIILNAKMFSDIVRKLPGEKVTISTDSDYVTEIKSGSALFSIVGMPTDEYPELPKFNKEYSVKFSSETFGSMIKQTSFAVSKNETNPVHKGIMFEIENKKMTAVAVDGFRLALRQENIEFDETYGRVYFIIPDRTLAEILNLLPIEDTDIKISFSKKHILLNIGQFELFSRLLDGNFLDYKATIPNDASTSFTINTRDFINSIERVSIVVDEKLKKPIHFKFSNNCIKVSCISAVGKANDQLAVKVEGEEIEMGFNNRYLLDALKNTHVDEVKVEIFGSIKPMKITSPDSDKFIFLVLPVRV